ncbi:MAG TPA: DUF4157 domain-containing protein, partial [Thermoanaerobaculia bacterium]|nr:DUF4157 domain-containing protein [Thermoanaerobaculia bacterium]
MSDIGRGIAASAPARVAATPVRAPMLARKCSCSGSDASCSKCAEEEMRGAVLHRKAMGGMTPGRIPDIVGRVLSSPGRPLDRDTRAEMESRFGHDFSAVRIHSGADAAASAHAVGAHAYTVGSDIVVGSNHDLHSPRGMRLLAHELTHTIQQRGVARVAVDSLPIAAADHSSEREADAVADAVMSGDEVRAPAVARHGLAMLSRLTETETIPETPGAKDALKLNAIAPADDFKSPDDTSIRWFRVTVPFPLPAEKGPRALSIWKGAAEAGEKSKTSLHMILDAKGNFKAALKATRSLTGTLRKMWLLSVGWPSDSATATKNWNDAGGSATDFFARSLVKVPKKDDDDGEVDAIDQADPVPAPVAEGETPKPPATLKACQFDHVVELQAGGPDAPSNLALLSGADNVRSAVLITKELRLRVSQIRAVYPDLQQVGLIYSSVAQQGSPSCSEACCRIETKARAARAKLEADAAAAGTKLSSVPLGP